MSHAVAPATTPATALAVCVFAVCPPDAAPPAGVRGHGEAPGPVRLLRAGPLAAAVQDVPAAAFDGDALRRRLADAAELERCARAHDAVVAALARAVPTVPLPLATLYLDEARARAALTGRAPRFLAALERVTGRAEWGVKAYQAAPAAAADAGGDAGEPAGAPSGRAYLERLRERQHGRHRHEQAALTAAERVDACLRGLAAAARRLRPHPPRPGGPAQLLNAAYLVDTGRAADLTAAVARLRDDPATGGLLRLEVTGPWAPYSFAAVPE
jgi:hypothetical protein